MKAFFLACALLFTFSGAWACSCIGENIPEKEKIAKAQAQATLIFTGRVVSEEQVELTDTVHFRTRSGLDTVVTSRQQHRKYTFAIEKQLKGRPGSASIVILTAGPGSSCSVSYQVGGKFLVFAYQVDKTVNYRGVEKNIPPYFVTGMCTRTKDLRHTKPAELRQLRQLRQLAKT